MLEQTSFVLRDTDYTIQQLPATRGMEVGIHLIKILMGASDGVGDIHEDEDLLDTPLNPAKMADGLFKRIDEKGMPTFIKTLIHESLIRPDPENDFNDWYERHFSANYDELFDLVSAIIDHNGYADLVKKRLREITGIFFSDDGQEEGSTRSS